MKQLIHGGDTYSLKQNQRNPILDFSANINPLGTPQSVIDAVTSSLSCCAIYPDPLCRKLTAAISQIEKIPQEWITCGNGAADIIFRLVYAKKPKTALILAPTFAEYEQALTAVDCKIRAFNLKSKEDFNITEDILNQIDKDVDVVFICNPNNPTGQLAEPSLLLKILDKCKANQTTLVVDECFNDFLDIPEKYTMKAYLKDYPNLFILKAFTKIYAMAGLRLGYGITNNMKLLEKIVGAGQPWSVSTIAQAAGIAALTETEYISETRKLIVGERAFLTAELTNLGAKIIGSKANYIFFKVKGITNLKEQLEPKGILIRSCGNYHGLTKEYYRIAVKSNEDNKVLITALGELLKI